MSTETTNKKIKIDNGTTFGRTYTDKAIDERLQGLVSKVNNSLQKPTGLTKTELVGVGTNGQENIEIGDNLTLANVKLSATGVGSGGGIPVVEGTMGEDGETITIPSAQTTNFILKWNDNYDTYYIFMNNTGGNYISSIMQPMDEGGIIFYMSTFLSGSATEIKIVSTQSIPILTEYANKSGYLYLDLDNNAPKLSFEPIGSGASSLNIVTIENFNDGDHNQQGFVMPTEDVVLFTDGSGTSLIGYKNETSYFCYEWTPQIESGLNKYKKFLYKISKGVNSGGFKIETIDISQVFDQNLMFLPNYSDSDNGKILAIDSGNPKWITSSSSSKTASLFGRHSILVPLSSEDSDINLFWHNITSVNGNNQLLIQIYSSNNLSVKSLSDLATLVQGVYRKIIAGGIYENSPIFMIDWKGYASSVFYTVANPTTGVPLSTFTTFKDDVIPA